MTGAFHTYIYTNCRADEGLQQRDGFQFQAVSPGANLSAMSVIQRRLLYEPSPQWMRERRPVSDYPPSFSHVYDSNMYATAAGLYVGRESTGGREGNQLTHAIATTDPSSYGLVRPAQLFGAPFWTPVQAPAQQCPPLEPGWQPGPFGVVEAQRFVRSQDRGEAMLTALVSHLRRGDDRRRVMFVAREPELVLRWVTAATLLIPHREALRIGFKIFTLNPAYADHRILAVHPEWSTGSASLDNQLGYVVFDLVAHDWTRVEPDPSCRRWVRLFLTEDPYDVADAVEVAAEVADGHRGLGPAGMSLALAVVLGRPPEPEAVPAITEWLATCRPKLLSRYGPDLIDRLLENTDRWQPGELIRLDEAVHEALPQRAAAVRLALLRSEIRELTDGGTVRPGTLAEIEDSAWRPDASDRLADAMRMAPPEPFEALLRLSARFGVAPQQTMLEPGLQSFVEHWLQHPELNYYSGDWAGGDEVEHKLKVLLNRRVEDDPKAADRLADLWCDTLVDGATGLATRLDEVLVSAGMRILEEDDRFRFVRDMLQAARDAPEPIATFEFVTAVLWRREPPTETEAERLLGLLPEGARFGPEHFPALSARLLVQRVEDEHFLAARVLAGSRAWTPPAPVMRALMHEGTMRDVLDELARAKVDPTELTKLVRRVPQHTLDNHRSELLEAMVSAKVAAAALAVLEETPDLQRDYQRKLVSKVARPKWHPAQMAMVFVLHLLPPPPDSRESDEQAMDYMVQRLQNFLTRGSDARRGEVDSQIELLGGDWPARWDTFTRPGRARRRITWLLRGDNNTI
ncbi:GTPase-associated protein 1-related protein [Actinoplanes sp. NPDC051861]|uniref:GTPase-associated protein 1-related protein n=1 Tax=Actinoplanes sp. NPDC051861 TaxID=3155170 RepID=UPI00341496F1